MKRILLILFVLSFQLLSLCLEAQTATAAVSPRGIRAGSEGVLTLSVESSSGVSRLPEFPEISGIIWTGGISRGISQSSINGVVSSKTTISRAFTAVREGTYTIPEMNFTLSNGKRVTTQRVQFTVKPELTIDEAKADPTQEVFASMSIPSKDRDGSQRKVFYTGETIPLVFMIYIRRGVNAEPSLPEFRGTNNVRPHFLDFAKTNPKYPAFESITESRTTLDGETFTCLVFTSYFRVFAPADFTPIGSVRVRVIDGNDLFSMRSTAKMLTSKTDPIEIKRLPSIPAGIDNFCGLIGRYDISAKLTAPPYRAGDPVTLTVTIKGEGLDSLKAPDFKPDGFRVYPPEVVQTNENMSELKYTLIPYTDGVSKLDFTISSFDPVKGEYVPFSFEKEMNIEKSNTSSGNGQPFTAPSVYTENGDTENISGKSDSLLYLRSSISANVLMPLERNALLWSFIMLGGGVAFFIVSLLAAMRRRALENDPAMRRRLEARSLKRGIATKLKASPPEEIFDRTGEELDSYLAAMLDLPRGSSLAECADALEKDAPELAECVRKLSEASWNPAAAGEFNESLKSRLVKAFSKFGVFLFALFSFGVLSGAETPQEAMTAYDTGRFDEALNYYADRIKENGQSGTLLYNLGNCYYKKGDLPMALSAYERALKLSPRSSDILENLNLTRRQLMLEEKRLLESPRDFPAYVRDSLRIDEWLILAAFGLMSAFVALGLACLRIRKRVWIGILTGGVLISILSVTMTLFQLKYTYTEKYAAVVERNAPLYSLPSSSGKVELTVKAGTECVISEKRSDFARVTLDGTEGWMKTSALKALWSENASDLL